jgi:beta-lactamase class A
MERRNFIKLGGVFLAGWNASAMAKNFHGLEADFHRLERHTGGRLGVSCLNTDGKPLAAYRADERFPMCSTFKWLAVAALLARVDAGHDDLTRRVSITRGDLLAGTPVVAEHLGTDGISLDKLCEAAIADSDNTAANLILREIGGIPAWNAYLRDLGDPLSRLDRDEPKLNEGRPGDPRDTTSPAAMSRNLHLLLLGNKLSTTSHEKLMQWMLSTRTGLHRLRADLPTGWRLANKTGSGRGTANDVGIYWPTTGIPLVISVYLTQTHLPPTGQDAAIAQVGHWLRDGRTG